jgi:site-specific recombinase XerD
MSDFEKFLCVQKNLSGATVKNHVRYLDIFLRSVRKSSDSIEESDIQEFMSGIKQTKSSQTYKNTSQCSRYYSGIISIKKG